MYLFHSERSLGSAKARGWNGSVPKPLRNKTYRSKHNEDFNEDDEDDEDDDFEGFIDDEEGEEVESFYGDDEEDEVGDEDRGFHRGGRISDERERFLEEQFESTLEEYGDDEIGYLDGEVCTMMHVR